MIMTDDKPYDAIYAASGLVALMREIDDTLEAGRFAVVRSLMFTVATESADTRMLLGILTACFPARSELGEAYTQLLSKTHNRLVFLHGIDEAKELIGFLDAKP